MRWFCNAMLLLFLLVGCKTYIPVETVRREVVKELEVQRDSIHITDSIFVKSVNDTIYLTRWRVEYRDVLRVDTFLAVKRDSINHVVEVEKKLTRMESLKMDVGAGVLYALPILIAVGLFILYRKLKK
jgi:hypothetical protein